MKQYAVYVKNGKYWRADKSLRQDFCPLYKAIEDFNKCRSKGEPLLCSKAKIDCSYIEKIVRQSRGESEG